MLTSFSPYTGQDRHELRSGFKAFPYGVAPSVIGQWLQSRSGPGFHIYVCEDAARRHVQGISCGIIREVTYHGIVLKGYEGTDEAVTAEWMMVRDEPMTPASIL